MAVAAAKRHNMSAATTTIRISWVPLLSFLLFLAIPSKCVSTITKKKHKMKDLMEEGSDFVPDCRDEVPQCADWAKAGYCEGLPTHIKPACRKSCPHVCESKSINVGVPQVARNAEARLAVVQTLEYLHTEVYADDLYESVRDKCINRHNFCSHWAAQGECDGDNAEWMALNCAPACQTCFDLDVGLRCYWDDSVEKAIEPGGLNLMFERITTSPEFEKYKPTILSRPSDDPEKDGPWIVTLDNVISEQECNTLIELGGRIGYERSEGQSPESSETGQYRSEVSDFRTSFQAWCQDECYEDHTVQQITERIAHITGVDESHYEFLQLLKYEPGQYYKSHHDFIDLQSERPMGPRILTFFLYLNDVEEGGGTRFTDLNLTVTPRRGRALLWPSVLDEDPEEWEERTHHEAMPVISGVKYGANAWLHLGNFKEAYENDCVW